LVKIVQVDKNDKYLGLIDKNKAHENRGILHRAICVFVVNNKKEILLQKRSKYKKLWPLYWSNTCCSHPKKGEAYVEAGERRLKEELGFSCQLKPLFKIYYQAKYKSIGAEKEISMILLGQYKNQKIKPNEKEIADLSWMSLAKVRAQIKTKPNKFTPWFKKIIKDKKYAENMRKICGK